LGRVDYEPGNESVTPFTAIVLGLLLGAAIGANAMWIYLMHKHAGRPIGWLAIVEGFSLGVAVLGFLFGR
jgi:hypothetical protein